MLENQRIRSEMIVYDIFILTDPQFCPSMHSSLGNQGQRTNKRQPLTIMETTSKLLHKISLIRGDFRYIIKISLDDDCKNGHEDFSLTATIDEKDKRGAWREYMGGCCHDEILKVRPDLKQFEALHLSDMHGVPMHAIANAWFWFQGAFPEAAETGENLGPCHGGTGSSGKPPAECRAIFADHIRATPEEVEAIAAALPRSQNELQFELERLGFPQRWKTEALAAIAKLEEMTGHKFESKATRICWEPLSDEAKADIVQKRESGYYKPENVAERDRLKREAAKAKKLADIEKDLKAATLKLKKKAMVERFLIVHDCKKNAIYYDHTNTLSVNWSNLDPLYTEDEFGALKTMAKVHAKELPEGLTLEWKAKPKY